MKQCARSESGNSENRLWLTALLTVRPYLCKYGLMKTTFDLPADLIHRAKVLAAQRRTTLKELVLQGLEYVTSHEPPDRETERKARAEKLMAALQANNTEPMRPLKRDELHDR